MRSTVLVLAQAGDSTADDVCLALDERGADIVRFDTADFPQSVTLFATPDLLDSPGVLHVGERVLDLDSVASVYRRHPAAFTLPGGLSEAERRFAMQETVAGLSGTLVAQSWRWIDAPGAVADASYKPRQLRVATLVGFRVPRTVITNSGPRAREFARNIDRPIIYKTLARGMFTEDNELKIVYTTPVNIDDLDDNAIASCCHLFQEWIPKVHDVRVVVVGDTLFPVAIQSTSQPGHVDWRSRYADLTYQECKVPEQVRSAINAYMSAMHLTYGAFDFSVDSNGRWWFLECNPSGQWGWLAEETGMPIADAIARELMEPA